MFAWLADLAAQQAQQHGRLAVTITHGVTTFATYAFDLGDSGEELQPDTLANRTCHVFKIPGKGITFDFRELDTLTFADGKVWEVLKSAPSPQVDGATIFYDVTAVRR